MNYKPCKIIAEIGNTHIADMKRAKSLIRLAKLAGADYVKFQKRNPLESVPKSIQNKPHPNSRFSYGDTYLEHRIALELNIGQHSVLKQYCEDIEIGYSTSVWDLTSADEVISLNPDFIKVPSACNGDIKLLKKLIHDYSGKIHVSLGMVSREERISIFKFFQDEEVDPKRMVLYHCTGEYPCPFENLYLNDLKIIKFGLDDGEIGFSNHGYGIAADIAAYTLGATWIERHFIDDRTFRHSDATASLEPDGLRRLCRDLKAVHKALKFKTGLSEAEKEQRNKLRISND